MKRLVVLVAWSLAAAFTACFDFDDYAIEPASEVNLPEGAAGASAGSGTAAANGSRPGVTVGSAGSEDVARPEDVSGIEGPQVSEGQACSGPDCSALGQTCADAASCESGFCANDSEDVTRCCDAPCNAPCQRCSADGSCSVVATSDASCAPVACPADDACRDFEDIAAGTCSAFGQCASASDCTFAWKPAAREGAACVDAGDRFVLSVGEACGSELDCATGCYATATNRNICCAAVCAPNQVCSEDGTACELAAVCPDDSVRCSGSSYQRCRAGQWVTETDCGTLGCDLAQNGCLRAVGDACTTTADCGAGTCQPSAGGGSVCCTASCNGSCQRCAPSGAACANLDDDASCGVIQCPADETCRDYPASVAQNRCRDGRCGTPGQLCPAGPRNVGLSCSATSLCDNAGNCSVPKRNLGVTCTTDAECTSGSCREGVCCDGDCSGLCETCATTGVCRAAADDDQCPDVLCRTGRNQDCVANFVDYSEAAGNRCVGRGVCRSENDCGFRGALACAVQGNGGVCAADGTCQLPTVQCGGMRCPPADPSMANFRCCVTDGTPTCSANCGGGFVVSCDNNLDCANGTVCATLAANQAIQCLLPSAGIQQLCGSADISTFGGFHGCLDCTGFSPAPGFTFCP